MSNAANGATTSPTAPVGDQQRSTSAEDPNNATSTSAVSVADWSFVDREELPVMATTAAATTVTSATAAAATSAAPPLLPPAQVDATLDGVRSDGDDGDDHNAGNGGDDDDDEGDADHLNATSAPNISGAGSGSPRKKEVKLSAADASSIMSRSSTFIPFNPWSQDIGQLSQVEKQLDEPIELTPMQKTLHSKLVRFQGDNNATLKHNDVLGFNYDASIRGTCAVACLAHAEDGNVVYAAGRHITVVGVDNPHRQMLLRAENCITINTFDVSSNGKYIAVSERRTDAPYVTVYKIDSNAKVASLNFKFLCKTQVIAVAFSSNNKYLATLSAEPDAKLFIWQLDDLKVLAMTELAKNNRAATAVRINPWQSLQMSSVHPNSFLLWRVAEKMLIAFDPVAASKRPLFKKTTSTWSWVSHTWYDEECVAAVTDNGYLLAVESNEVKLFVNVLSETMDKVTHVAWASRGILIAGSNGTILLMDRTYASSVFVAVAEFRTTERNANVIGMSVSPAELNIVVALSNNTMEWMPLESLDDTLQQIADDEAEALERLLSDEEKQAIMEQNAKISSVNAGFNLETSKMLRNSMAAAALEKSGLSPAAAAAGSGTAGARRAGGNPTTLVAKDLFRPMHHVSFHSGAVTSMSFALQRPIVVTTSSDCFVRVFDFVNHETLVAKKLEDEVLSGSVHPMGLHVVLTFRFSAKVYAILDDDLMQMTELNIKSAHEVRFSPTGAKIAFAVANRVVVHDGHSYAFLGMLVGHTSMVKSISWMPNGDICTSDIVGMLLCWNSNTFKRTGVDSSQKSLIFQHALFDPETQLFAAVGSNKHARGKIFEGEFTIVCASSAQEETLVYVRPGMVLPKALAARKLHCHLLALAQLSKTLFVGTPTGRVLLFSWPLLATSKPYDYIDSHGCEIVQLYLSPNERYLFTIGSDHLMYMYEVTQLKGGKFVSIEPFDYSIFNAVRYKLASDLDDKDREVYALRRRLEDRVAESEAHLSLLAGRKEAEMKEFAQRAEAEIEQLRRAIDKVTAEVAEVERRTQEHTQLVESQHIHTAEEIENLYNKRSEDALKQFRALEAEKEELVVRYEAVVAKKIAEGDLTKTQLEANRREVERNLSKQVEELREKIRFNARRYDAMIAQTVVDMETDIGSLKDDHANAVKTNEEKVVKAATSASVGDREAERQKREIAIIQHQLDSRSEVHRELQIVADKRLREIKQIKVDMLSKQEAINVAEKNMQSLKSQLTVLENLRFVLTYQFDELQSEVVPKDGKIRQLEARIVEMEEDLQHINVERNATKDRVAAVDAHLAELTEVQRDLKVRQLDIQRRYKTFNDELWRLQERYRDATQFAVDFERTLREAKQTFDYKEPEVDVEAQRLAAELKTHQEFLNAKNSHQVAYAEKKQKGMEERSHELLAENSSLVQEVKVLRQERKKLHSHCTSLELQLKDTRVGLHRLTQVRAITAPPSQSQPHHSVNVSSVSTVAAPATVGMRTPSPSSQLNVPRSAGPSSSSKAKPVLLPPIDASPIGSNTSTATAPAAFKKRAAPSPSSKGTTKKVPASTAKPLKQGTPEGHRTHLQDAIAQLERNSERMRDQEGEIETLRVFAQDLLRAEEERLMTHLRAFPVVGSPPSGGAAAAADAPDWNVESRDAARPMTPGSGLPPAPRMV